MNIAIALLAFFSAPQTGGLPPSPKIDFCGHNPTDEAPPNVKPDCRCVEKDCMGAAEDNYQFTMQTAYDAACTQQQGFQSDCDDAVELCDSSVYTNCILMGGTTLDCSLQRMRCVSAAKAALRQQMLDLKQSVAITQQGAVQDYIDQINLCCVDCDDK